MNEDGERQRKPAQAGEGNPQREGPTPDAEGPPSRDEASPRLDYEEGYLWLHRLLTGAGYDPSRDSPESFMGRMSAQSDRIAELERLLAARVEHCARVHGCRVEVA